MNLNELEERLQLLSDQGVITQKAYDIAILSFKKLLHVLNTENMEQAEMLFTHLLWHYPGSSGKKRLIIQ